MRFAIAAFLLLGLPLSLRAQDASPTPRSDTVRIRIASGTKGAVLYVNDVRDTLLSGVRTLTVKPGTHRLSVRAPNCTPWDTTITVEKGTVTIGRRFARC